MLVALFQFACAAHSNEQVLPWCKSKVIAAVEQHRSQCPPPPSLECTNNQHISQINSGPERNRQVSQILVAPIPQRGIGVVVSCKQSLYQSLLPMVIILTTDVLNYLWLVNRGGQVNSFFQLTAYFTVVSVLHATISESIDLKDFRGLLNSL